MTTIDDLRNRHNERKTRSGIPWYMGNWEEEDIDALFAHIDALTAQLARVTAERDVLRSENDNLASARVLPTSTSLTVASAYEQQDKFNFAFGITPIDRIEKSSVRVTPIDNKHGYRDVDVYLLYGPGNNGTKLSASVTLFVVGERKPDSAPSAAPAASDTEWHVEPPLFASHHNVHGAYIGHDNRLRYASEYPAPHKHIWKAIWAEGDIAMFEMCAVCGKEKTS